MFDLKFKEWEVRSYCLWKRGSQNFCRPDLKCNIPRFYVINLKLAADSLNVIEAHYAFSFFFFPTPGINPPTGPNIPTSNFPKYHLGERFR